MAGVRWAGHSGERRLHGPGNWGTDLAGGAQFKYGLLWVVALASLMAIFLQLIAARLGVATGKDLAQCCRNCLPRWTRWPNWISMEFAICMTDLAESLGSAVALNMLFHIPMQWAIIITAFDVLLLLALQGFGMRLIEAVVAVFVITIGGCYAIEIFGLVLTRPDFLKMVRRNGAPRLYPERHAGRGNRYHWGDGYAPQSLFAHRVGADS